MRFERTTERVRNRPDEAGFLLDVCTDCGDKLVTILNLDISNSYL